MGRRGPRNCPRARRRDRVAARHLCPRASAARCDRSLDLGVCRRDHRAPGMKTLISTHSLSNLEAPLLVIVIAQGASAPIKEGSLERAIAIGDYKGKRDETLLVYGGGKAQRILLVGVGKPGDVTRSVLRRAAAVAAKRTRAIGATAFTFAVATEACRGISAGELGQVTVEGAAHGGWQFTQLKQPGED